MWKLRSICTPSKINQIRRYPKSASEVEETQFRTWKTRVDSRVPASHCALMQPNTSSIQIRCSLISKDSSILTFYVWCFEYNYSNGSFLPSDRTVRFYLNAACFLEGVRAVRNYAVGQQNKTYCTVSRHSSFDLYTGSSFTKLQCKILSLNID